MLEFFFDPVGSIISLVPVWAWWLLALFAVIFVIGVLCRLKDVGVLIHKIAGWPGVAAVVGVILTLVYLIWPKVGEKEAARIKKKVVKKYPIPAPYDRYNGKRFHEGKHQKFNQLTGEWEDV